MPGSPENKAWLSVNYEVPNVFGGDLWFYYDIAYQSETWSRISDIRDDYKGGLADSWTFSNFSAGLYLNNGVDITFKVRNLFDEHGWNNAYTSYDDYGDEFFGGDPRFKSTRSLDVPRTMSLTFRKAF
jgi:outer membrane receptor protein involved in Fe transport